MSDSLLRRAYVQAVLEAYAQLPDTPQRPRPADRRLAEQLHDRNVPESVVRDALLLARARRLIRPRDAPPLAKVRSLRYFLPVIAYSEPSRPLIPIESGHPFRGKPAGHSD